MPQLKLLSASLDDIRAKTQIHLAAWLERARQDAEAVDPSYLRLWDGIEHQVLSGGKLLRPVFTVMSYVGFGGRSQAIYDVAAAQELLHISLLIHDDIMDHDYMRRGRPNLAGEYLKHYSAQQNPPHLAMSAALLGGDLLLAGAHEQIAVSAFKSELKQAAAAILARQIYEVAAGQLLDMESGQADQSPEYSLKIARLKTAAYSFTGPLLMGAVLAEAPLDTQTQLEELGNALGTGFQLADDLLGTFGDEAKTGKSMLSDMREGKPTYLVRRARDLANSVDRQWLTDHWGNVNVTAAELTMARAIIERSGAKDQTQTLMRSYTAQARASLDNLGLSRDASTALQGVIERSIWRQA